MTWVGPRGWEGVTLGDGSGREGGREKEDGFARRNILDL